MVTIFNQPANTYLSTTPGGTIAAAASKDEVVQWVKSLEPWKTPILDKVMSNDEFDQEVHQWGKSFRIGFESTLATALTDGTETTVEVAPGDGLLFQEKAVIEVYETLPNTEIPDPSTREVMWVTDINGDELTVIRGFGTSAMAHDADSVVNFLGTAEELNSEHTEAPRIRGIRQFNYPQRFQAKLTADKRNQNMPTYEHESNPLLADFSEEMLKQKRLLERSVFRGVRKQGVGNTLPSMFGGIDYFLQTNVVNMSGDPLHFNALDNVLADIWEATDSAEKLTIVGSMDTIRILDQSIPDERREYTSSDTEVRRMVTKYHFRTGTFEAQPTRNVPNGVLYLLDFNNIKVRPFKGLNWHTSGKDGADHAVDHDVKAISGDFTLELLHEEAMAKFYNFDGVLENYTTTTP